MQMPYFVKVFSLFFCPAVIKLVTQSNLCRLVSPNTVHHSYFLCYRDVKCHIPTVWGQCIEKATPTHLFFPTKKCHFEIIISLVFWRGWYSINKFFMIWVWWKLYFTWSRYLNAYWNIGWKNKIFTLTKHLTIPKNIQGELRIICVKLRSMLWIICVRLRLML